MKVILTDYENHRLWEEQELQEGPLSCMKRICVYPSILRQTVQGFGGAFTESAAYCYDRLPEEAKEKLLRAYFGPEGLCYNLGRTHINSCDFSLGNYACDEEESDENLEQFSMERENRYIFPFLRDAERCRGGKIRMLLSPWSPPAYMKTNGEMNHGGKLKEGYYERWAKYMTRFAREMKEQGFEIGWMTVQNEPDAVQTWDSCRYTAAEEARFAGGYLGPELKKAGLNEVRLLVWDHNKEEAYSRIRVILEKKQAAEYVDGIAVHWYTGDHFENIGLIREAYPGLEILFTEGCVEYSRFGDSSELEKAEMYAHDMIGNFRQGVSAHLDWNLLLDSKGGPNHVGNFCAAPVMCREGFEDVYKNLSYYYIGHFSRYVKPGAHVVPVSAFCQEAESVAFRNPDGEIVLVVLNRTGQALELSAGAEGRGADFVLPPRSIATFIL